MRCGTLWKLEILIIKNTKILKLKIWPYSLINRYVNTAKYKE